MEVKTLYRYTRPDGGVTVSTVPPEGEHTTCFRLIAGEGMALSREGSEPVVCVDTDSIEGWTEIEYQFTQEDT